MAVRHAQSPHTGTSENMEHSEMPDKNSRSVILTVDVETRGVEKVQSVLWKLEGTITSARSCRCDLSLIRCAHGCNSGTNYGGNQLF